MKRVPLNLDSIKDNRKRTLLHVAAMNDQIKVEANTSSLFMVTIATQRCRLA